MYVRLGGIIFLILLPACTPHDYKHRIATTYQHHRYYCDTVLQDKQGLYFKNTNGTIVRILADAPFQNQYKDAH